MNLPLVQNLTVTQTKGQSKIICIIILFAVVWGQIIIYFFSGRK